MMAVDKRRFLVYLQPEATMKFNPLDRIVDIMVSTVAGLTTTMLSAFLITDSSTSAAAPIETHIHPLCQVESPDEDCLVAALGDYVSQPPEGWLPPPQLEIEDIPGGPPVPRTLEELELVHEAAVIAGGMEKWLPELHAQTTVESRWDTQAESPVGAKGAHQFMPATWGDEAPKVGCNEEPPTDGVCSSAAQTNFMRRLLNRFDGSIQNAAAAYNAGAGWILKEQNLCALALDCDPTQYIGHVERFCSKAGRAPWACAQTSKYARSIVRLAKDRRVEFTVEW